MMDGACVASAVSIHPHQDVPAVLPAFPNFPLSIGRLGPYDPERKVKVNKTSRIFTRQQLPSYLKKHHKEFAAKDVKWEELVKEIERCCC